MKKSLLLFILPLLLVGCGNENVQQIINYDLSNKYEDLASDPDYEEVNDKCSLGGWFLEVNTGRCLATNGKYEFIFKSSTSSNPSFTVKSSDPRHATVEIVDSSTFYLYTHTAGDIILSVYNADEYLCYRHIVRIRPAVEVSQILSVVGDAEYYDTLPDAYLYTGSWKYTLIDNDSGQSVITGKDEMEIKTVTISFYLVYSRFIQSTELQVFRCKDEKDYTKSTYISSIAFSKTCDLAYIYYSAGPDSREEHLLTILYNINCDYIYHSDI